MALVVGASGLWLRGAELMNPVFHRLIVQSYCTTPPRNADSRDLDFSLSNGVRISR